MSENLDFNKFNEERDSFKKYVTTMVGDIFAKDGHLSPVLLMSAYVPEKDGLGLFVFPLNELFMEGKDKDDAAREMRKAVEKVQPFITCFLTEGWMKVFDTKTEEGKTELNQKITKDQFYKGDYSVAKDPTKIEVINCQFETHEDSAMVIYKIIREEKKKPVLEEFQNVGWEKSDKERISGRFSGLLSKGKDSFIDWVLSAGSVPPTSVTLNKENK